MYDISPLTHYCVRTGISFGRNALGMEFSGSLVIKHPLSWSFQGSGLPGRWPESRISLHSGRVDRHQNPARDPGGLPLVGRRSICRRWLETPKPPQQVVRLILPRMVVCGNSFVSLARGKRLQYTAVVVVGS